VADAPRLASRNEEHLNALTHGLACLAAVVGSVFVLRAAVHSGTAWQLFSCAFYALTMVATYAASTLSHVFQKPARREWWRTADQALIFLYIAGSFTPMGLTWLRTGNGWWLIGGIWAVAAVGFVSKVVFAHNVRIGSVTTWLYLVLGWMPVLATYWLWNVMPTGLFAAMYLGGICYTLGLVFFHYDARIKFCHVAWHLAVIAGSACHFYGIITYCTAEPPMPPAPVVAQLLAAPH
jgi:hemolysin III